MKKRRTRSEENEEIQEREKDQMMKVKRFRSIKVLLEEVEVLIDTHFNEFNETKSSQS